MFNEFSISVKSQNKKAKYAFGGCLGSALIFVIAYMNIPKYQGIVGIGALAFITAAIYIYNRYVAAEYGYDVTVDSVGRPVFVVRQKVGKRNATVCRIDLYGISSIEKLDKETRRNHKTEKGVLKYVYGPTLMPDTIYLISSRTSREKADLYVEATDEFASALREAVRLSREYVIEEE